MIITIGIIVAILVIIVSIFYYKNFFPLRPRGKGFEFVFVEEDGSVRELYDDEKTYLNTKFLPSDGARPYIKSSYDETVIENRKIAGYIRRIRVPKEIHIREVEKPTPNYFNRR